MLVSVEQSLMGAVHCCRSDIDVAACSKPITLRLSRAANTMRNMWWFSDFLLHPF